MPSAGRLINLYVYADVAAGSSQNMTISLFKNGSTTALSCTLLSTSTIASNTTNSITCNAGDLMCWYYIHTNSAGLSQRFSFSCLLIPN